MKKNYGIIAAGGTGGHINGAISLGDYLEQKGNEVLYLTGERELDFKLFNGKRAVHLKTSALRYKNPFKVFKSLTLNLWSFFSLMIKFIQKRPLFVIGCGGYVCGPSLAAAYILRIPTYIVEQNAVMGMTNKILGHISKKIFLHFQKTKGLSPSMERKVVVSGNPTRSQIKQSPRQKSEEINILVFGGSLGATQINRIIKIVFEKDWSLKIRITHQIGLKNELSVRPGENVSYHQVKYIDDMQTQYDKADLIICRAGASSISELRIVQKPVILIPYPAATDNHQFYNAIELKNEADFFVGLLEQKDSDEINAQKVEDIINDLANIENKGSNAPVLIQNSAEVIINEVLRDITK